MKQFFTRNFKGRMLNQLPALFSVKFLILCYFLCGGALRAQNITPIVTGYTITDNNGVNTQCTFAGEAFLLNVSGTDFRTDFENGNVQVQVTPTTGGSPVIVQVLSVNATGTNLTVNIPASVQPTAGILSFIVRNRQGNSDNYNDSNDNTITVYALPGQITGSQTVCDGDTETYTIPGQPDYSYRWEILNGAASFPNGNTGNDVQVNVEFGPGSGTVTLGIFATSPCGNEMRDPTTFVVEVHPLPDIIQIAGGDIVCPSDIVQLDVTAISNIPAPNDGLSYSWTLDGQPISNYPSIIVQQSGERLLTPLAGTYELTLTNAGGCVATAQKVIQAGSIPAAPSTTSAERCGDGSLTLAASGAAEGNYRWFTVPSGGTAITGETGSTFTTPNLTATTQYWVAAVNELGCISSRTPVTATINFQPEVSISGVTALCEGDATTLTATVTNDPGGITYSYQWFRDEVLTGTSATLNVTDEGTYRIEVTTPEGCTAVTEQLITVNPAPNVTLNASSTEICRNETVTLTASGANSYSWSPETGLDATTGPSVTATPKSTTTYTVIGTGADGCTSTTSVTIIVNQPPNFSVAADDNLICEDQTTTLNLTLLGDNNNGNTYTYEPAEFVVSISSNGLSAVVDPDVSTTFTISATNQNGCQKTRTIRIDVSEPPITGIEGPDLICDNNSFTLSAANLSSSFITAYEWYYNGSIVSGETSSTVIRNIGGTYGLRVQDDNNCWSAIIEKVVNESTTPPTPTISGDLAYCEGKSTILTANAVNAGETYQWYRDGNLLTGETNQSLTVTTAGTYDVEVDNAGCTSAQASVTVTENDNPTLTVIDPEPVCAPSTVDLTAEGIVSSNQDPNVTYSYWINAGATQPLNNPEAVTTSGTYYILATNSVTGCESVVDVEVTINPQPALPTITSVAEDIIYTGERSNITLAATPAGGQFFLDDVAIGNQLVPCTLDPDAPNVLTYRLTSGAGCTNEVSKTIDVRQSTYTVINRADPFTICRGQNTRYTAYVYRDVEVIYPYNEDPQSIIYNNRATTYNPAYDPYLPSSAQDIHKAFPVRFFQPEVILGDEGELLSSSNFTYQWTKNDQTFIGNDREFFNNAGLSSTDYFAVYVNKIGNTVCDANIINERSNPLFIAQPEGYTINVTAPSPICEGDAITFTAELGEGEFGNFWEDANVVLEWFLERDGTEYLIKTVNGVSETQDPTLTSSEIIDVIGTDLQDGDQVFVRFNSDLSNLISAKCLEDQQSTIAEITVNSLTASADDQSTTICTDESATFNLNVSSTGPNPVSYEWFVDGVSAGTAESLTLSNLAEGTYEITAQVSNICITEDLNVGTLTVRDIDPISIVGDASYCELNLDTEFSPYIEGAEQDVNYTLRILDAGNNVVYTDTRPGPGNNGQLFFSTAGVDLSAGNYTMEVEASFANSLACTETTAGSGVIEVEAATTVNDGALELWYTEDPNVWELRLVDNSYAAQLDALKPSAKPYYLWTYTLEGQPQQQVLVDGNSMGSSDPNIFSFTVPDGAVMESASLRLYPVFPGNSPEACMNEQFLQLQNLSPLPVEMLYFKGTKEGNTVILSWATAAEENNLGFDVQVSGNGFDYRSLGFVDTKNGNSTEGQTYSFVDTEENKFGTRYYRLEQQDIDGKTEFFGPIAVFINDTQQMMASPNPFREEIKLTVQAEEAQPMEVSLYNANGQLMGNYTLELEKGTNVKVLPVSNSLPAGLYFISGKMGAYQQRIRIMKQ